MNRADSILTPAQVTDRQRAIVEAGRLIDALTDGNGDLVKDAWYTLGKYVRPALAEIRQAEVQKLLSLSTNTKKVRPND